MTDVENIKSLAMLKMEKNFIAYNDKGYPRQPYSEFNLLDCFGFVKREMKELGEAIRAHWFGGRTNPDRLMKIRNEIADVSNCLDYLYEKALRLEIILLGDEMS